MAIIPNMRYQDNFLFTHTADAAHNAVNHTISLLAITLLTATAAALIALLLKKSLLHKNLDTLSEPDDPELLHRTYTVVHFSIKRRRPTPLVYPLTLLTALIAFLLTPLSAPIWQHLPELAYLQFPWRLLTLLTPILALTIALLLDTPTRPSKLSPSAQNPASGTWVSTTPTRLTTALTLLLPLALAVPAYRLFHQPPDPTDNPTHLAQLFRTHHGFPPTDEYTPTARRQRPAPLRQPRLLARHPPQRPRPRHHPHGRRTQPQPRHRRHPHPRHPNPLHPRPPPPDPQPHPTLNPRPQPPQLSQLGRHRSRPRHHVHRALSPTPTRRRPHHHATTPRPTNDQHHLAPHPRPNPRPHPLRTSPHHPGLHPPQKISSS